MKILSVASARPNFVKLAAVHHALKKHPDVRHVIVHTGQHHDPLLSDVFFKQLQIADPDHNLGIQGGTNEEQQTRVEEAMIEMLKKEKPDVVLVYGDVNGAVAAARAAHGLKIRIGHVEAGLRSRDMDMPEERNRIAIDQIADILFCTEQSGVDNLKAEKVKGQIELVGNTMIDTLIRMMPTIVERPLPFDAAGSRFAIVTLHRPSNVDDIEHISRVFGFLSKIARGIPVVLPLHPRTRKKLEESKTVLLGRGMFAIDPLGYSDFIRQMSDASFILTDSGGIQEETVLLKKRCFTLRKNTERPVTIESGSNVLIDIDKEEDRQKVLEYAAKPEPIDVTIPPLWDGKAGERIADFLIR